LKIIGEHGLVDVEREQKIIEKLIKMSWERRGIYPSLGTVLDIIVDNSPEDESIGRKIVEKVVEENGNDPSNIDSVFHLLEDSTTKIPGYLKEFSSEIKDMQQNLKRYVTKIDLLKKLSLFTLTRHQLERIVFQKDNPFKKTVSSKELVENPYLIPENYVPGKVDVDEAEIADEEIDVSKIDIGMIPDKKYLKIRNDDL